FNLGNLHERRNAPQKALDAYRAGLERARTAEDEGREARAHHNIGTILLYQGQVDEALHELRRALELRRKLNARSDLATTLNRIGDAYQRLDKLDEAFEHLREALELRRADGNPRGLAVGLTSLGNLYLRQGRRPEAAECYEEALTLVREIGRRHDEAVLLINLGRHNEDSGDGAGTLALYEQAIALFQLTGHPRGEAYARYASARILHDLGAFTAARSHLEDAIAKIEELRPEFEQEGLRMAFFATKQEFYELLIDVLMHLDEQVPEPAAGYGALALEVNERRRARVLLDLLSEARAEVRRGVDPELLAREARVQEALNATHRTVIAARRSSSTAVSAAHEARQGELIRELEEVRRKIRKKSPRYAELMQPEPLTADEIRALLDRDDLMLVYSLGEERSFLWSLSPSDSRSYVLPGRAEIERLAFAAYRHWARVGLRTGDSGDGAVRQLGAALLEAVAGELGNRRLVIVADGALQYLPFAALPDPVEPAVPLVVDHEIVQLPSATVLATLRREVFDREPAPFDVALIADPVFHREDPRVERGASSSAEASGSERVPGDLQRAAEEMGIGRFSRLTGTRREAEAVGALIPEDMRLDAFDFDASRATVLSGDLDRFKVLHFATHGFTSPRHPELSGLVLSLVDEAGNPQDGFLRLHEIYNLDLPAELVVLSGCRTGLGAEVAGEGMVGLTRGFMYAGVPRVIVSLWKVDDESTAELMKRFYTGVFEDNLSPAAALRTAQLSLRQDERWQDPYHWAPFVFQGEWLLEPPKVDDTDSHIEPEEGGGEDLDPIDSEIGPPQGWVRSRGSGRDEMVVNDVNGVDGATGEYLPPPPSLDDVVASIDELVLHPAVARERQWVAESRSDGDGAKRLPGYGIDPRELASAGWGVIFAPDIDGGTRAALKPLLDHRKAEAGARFGVYEYPLGKSKDDFLADLGVGFGPVDPKQVPYYLLLVGDPRTLPFRFQYELDMQYA
ncbi:MAG: CHAT domain-containing protein, partial [bacterium]|nr:CHAT domain-containing protein [bacterium]